MAKILFYSPVQDLILFERVGFYSTDIKLLSELGHEVVVACKLTKVMKESYDYLFAYFYTWSSLAVVIARCRGKLTVMTGGADMLDPNLNKSLIKLFIHRGFFRLGYLFSSKILVSSSSDLKNLSKLVGQKKLSLVPHVVDINFFTPGTLRYPQTLLTIGWMGLANVKRKGMDSAIRVIAELHKRNWIASLIIAGTKGPGTEYLRQLAADLEVIDYVEFKFSISEDEKLALLQSCGYYLQFSEYEGFGLATLEALSCGAFVLHTGSGGLADFMSNHGNLHAWPVNVEEVARFIINKDLMSFSDSESISQHRFVKENFSYPIRSKAFANTIKI